MEIMCNYKPKKEFVGGTICKLIQPGVLKEIYDIVIGEHRYTSKLERVKCFLKELKGFLDSGIEDFYVVCMDPSFNEEEGRIYFEEGKLPALGQKLREWSTLAESYDSERGSRLGSKSEYVIFLWSFVLELVNKGKTMDEALYEICIDSTELGRYYKKDDPHKFNIMATGCNEVCDYFDVAGNTKKILMGMFPDEEKAFYEHIYYIAGGDYYNSGADKPMYSFDQYNNVFLQISHTYVGWVIFPAKVKVAA